MLEYILRLLILLPIVGGTKQDRPVDLVGVLPLGPGSKLAVVEFAGQQILIAVSRNGITRLADNSQGDFHVD